MARFDESNGKSAAEIEREIEEQRGRVSSTIDQIQTKLSPGQIIDQLMGTSGAQDFAQNMGKQVRDNPIPVALLGASLLWLMAGKNPIGAVMPHGHDRSRGTSDGLMHEPYYDDPGIGGNGMDHGHGVTDALKGVAGTVRDAAGQIKDAASGIGEKLADAKHQAGRALHDARDGIGSVGQSVSGAAGSVAEHVKSLGGPVSDMQDSLTRLLRDQPLIAGALAFAAGAALGAALPVTSKEKELMGDAAAKAADAVKEAAEPIVQQGKQMLGHVVEEGKDVVEQVVEDGKEVLADAQNKLGETYAEVKDEVTSSLGKLAS